jgi:hypothetical protein
VTFQSLQVPADLRGPAALLLLLAIGVSALTRDRLAALLAGGAIAVALLASFFDLYPFGPSRHNAWLLAFTLPALGWLAGRVVDAGRRATGVAVGLLVAAGLFGSAIGGTIAADPPAGISTEERAVRRSDVQALVAERLAPSREPRLVLMSFQTFNLLMPLYAAERQQLMASSTPEVFGFAYGSRDVVVVGQWDWGGFDHVRQVVESLPERLPEVAPILPGRALLLAGGWESSLLGAAEDLERSGAIVDAVRLSGGDGADRAVPRLAAYVLDLEALRAASPAP